MKKVILIFGIILFILLFIFTIKYINNEKIYYSKDFDIAFDYSNIDKNSNGVDDYIDIFRGAIKDANNKPRYVSKYYAGGYPPEDEGVCTDVIWRALKNAGYYIKDMINTDIINHTEDYPRVDVVDANIDFRRVKNIKVFLDKYYMKCSLDPYEIDKWQAGDIVIFGDDYCHIGIVSDKRNRDGVCYLIHNAGQKNREEDKLIKWHNMHGITGHYRFLKIN